MDELPKRKPNRLKNYDYSATGAYFVTICVKDMKCVLSTVVGEGFRITHRKEVTVYIVSYRPSWRLKIA